jgi:hypothetical protein
VYSDGTTTDNSDSEAIMNGSVSGASIMFTEAGAVPCVYTGTASRSLPASMSGTISCVETFQGTSYNTTGTWQPTKQ